MNPSSASPSRRAVLLGGVTAMTALLAGCASETTGAATTAARPSASSSAMTTPTPTPTPTPTFTRPAVPRQPAKPGTITGLPSAVGNAFAWTCDDGIDADVILAYAALAERTGARFTFFLNGDNPAVTATAPKVRPLVEAGVIQIGNHTWSHPALTKLSDADITYQLQHNHDFLQQTFGVDPRPFYRPPFGFHNARVDAVAASLGYTVPVMWYGSLADSGVLTPAQILALGQQWFLPAHIVIAHLNHPPVISVLDQLWGIVQQKGLSTVTLNDVFSSTYHP